MPAATHVLSRRRNSGLLPAQPSCGALVGCIDGAEDLKAAGAHP